ncbi:restriction endonuclease subunit S [uncultured Duncaniella sp.]|jgi:type I restriction enzyme S subunit|uniref:restriction endonuclease subunit S n=1 Tax=uncultured Duncaniella sp. TaxID=2768039 RepID=UPI0025A5A9E9|nr:restriction endonuclease subunit S [uncultured Duncaniella sp.]
MNYIAIKDIVRSVSQTHKFEKDYLKAVNTSDVFGGELLDVPYSETTSLKGQFKKTIQFNDILFSEIRPANRRFGRVNIKDTADYVVSTKLMVLRKFNEDVDLDYFYYCLTNQSFLETLQRRAENRIGSFPQITFDLLGDYRFPIPTLAEQKRIASVIANIDSKIRINREINRNLEAMARQLYDYWFVQFDFPDENGKPYKSSGGKMVWNEKIKREIPEGWKIVSLPTIATFTNGLACQKFRPKSEDEKLPVIKIREMRDGITSESEWVAADIPDAVKVYDGDILFSWSASLEVMIWTGGEGGLNQHIFKVEPKSYYPKAFVYIQILDYISVFKGIAEARKTTMGHITQDHLNQSQIVIPASKSILQAFENTISPIVNLFVKLSQQSKQLMRQRDKLLPLLMNGQVSVMPREINCDLSHD